MLNMTFFNKADKANFPSIYPDYQKLLPRYQKMADYNINRIKNGLCLCINESAFINIQQMKLFGDYVYGLIEEKNRTSFSKEFRKKKKQFLIQAGTRRILDIWLKQRGALVLTSKNDSDFRHFRDNFENSYNYKSAWQMNAIGIKEDLDFAKICLMGHVEAAEAMLKKNPKLAVDSTSNNKLTAFDCSVYSGNIVLIKLVFEGGSRPTINPYSFAIKSGDAELALFLIRHYPDLKVCWEDEGTLFPRAVLLNEPEVLHFLLQKGLRLDDVDSDNETAMHYACRAHLNKMVKFLIGKKALVAVKNKDGHSALHTALWAENVKAIELLIKHCHNELFEQDYDCYHSVLHYLCKKGCLPLVEIMIGHNVHKDVRGSKGMTALHQAVASGNAQLVQFLLQNKFPFDAKDDEEKTALHHACSRNDQTMVLALLDTGSDVNSQDKNGCTPLFSSSDVDMYKLLVDRGADVNHQNKDGHTVIMLQNRENVILQLLEVGSVNTQLAAKDHNSLLSSALAFGYDLVVKKIAEKKAALNPRQASFVLLESVAIGNKDTAQLAIANGADPNFIFPNGDFAASAIMFRNSQSEQDKIVLLEFLFDHGADINIQAFGHGLLDIAAHKNLPLVCEYLMKKGLTITPKGQCRALNYAISNRNLQLAQILLPSDTAHISDTIGWAIAAAINAGLEDFALELIERGANINLVLTGGTSLLDEACVHGYKNLVFKLLEKGAHVEVSTFSYIFTHIYIDAYVYDKEGVGKLFKTGPLPSYVVENKKEILAMLLAKVPLGKKELTQLLVAAFISQPSVRLIKELLTYITDVSLLENSEKKLIWHCVYKSGNIELYHLVAALNIDNKLSLYEKLILLENAKHSELLKIVLKEEGRNLLYLKGKELKALIPYDAAIHDIYKLHDQGFFSILKSLNKLAHSFAIKRKTELAKKEIDLTGAVLGFSREIEKTFVKFIKQYQEQLTHHYAAESIQKMRKCLASLVERTTGNKLEEELIMGNPIMLFSGFKEHAIGVVVFLHPITKRCHILIANRGNGANPIGISEIVIEKPNSLEETFNRLNKYGNPILDVDSKSGVEVIDIEQFWSILAKIGIQRQQANLLMQQFPQQNGTCAHDNIKGAIGALFYAQSVLDGYGPEESLKAMLKLYKLFSSFERNDTLSEALDVVNPETYPADLEFDETFFKQLFEKIMLDSRIDRKWVKRLQKTIEAFAIRDIATWS